jgi:Asp-tRNA(Asn)/Glu-tRNA(Gln) amidotransferase A subunit family amidase
MTDRLEALFAEREPEVLAFLPEEGRFDRLRREARSAPAGPLSGWTVGVKDIFHVDGFPTGGGSSLPPEVLAGPEASCVTALRQAGALILGKTVSTEFAYFAPGPTRNPHNPEHTPGGSSSGSAAAVAAGLCPLALGSQTIGSVIRPAAFCGVVGFKPSYDRISRHGVIPLAPSFDHVGFFTADVEAAERAAAVLLGDWQPATSGRRPRLGVPEGPYLERATGEGLDHFRRVARRLAEAGYEVVPVPALADSDEVVARHFRIFAAEAARVHRDWFARFGDRYQKRTADLIRRGQEISDEDLDRDLDVREGLRTVLTARMDQHGIDLWISPPALGPAPQGLGSTGDPVMNIPWTQAGLPTLGLPAGRAGNGLPLGLQVTGRWWADADLLAWGRDLEKTVAV